MLPPGAPLPDEEHLDYSIAVEYDGGLDCFEEVPRVKPLTLPTAKPPKFRKSPSVLSRYPLRQKKSSSGSSSPASKHQFSCGSDSEAKQANDQANLVPDSEADCVNPVTPEAGRDDDYNDDDGDGSKGSSPLPGEVDDQASRVEKSGELNGEARFRFRATICSRCGKKNRLREKEVCIVCDALYCKYCVLKAMGSMPEGRKCLGCIGLQINEANREKLGKPSRMLAKVCSPLEVKQIMKAEMECSANQIRPEQVWVNGRQLREEELAELLGCVLPPEKLRPGRYWYDKDSGLWGKEGEKPDRFISSKLNVGGKLQLDASSGNTKVYINGREITKVELRVLKLAKVDCPRNTHFWLYDDGSYEEEGQNNIRGNIWEKAFTRFLCSLFSLPVPPGNTQGPKEDATAFSGRSVPGVSEHCRFQKLLLFGLEGSGTSTLFKQMKFMYGNEYTADEVQNIKLMIQSNMYRYLSILLEDRERFEEEALMEKSASTLQVENHSPGEMKTDESKQCIYSLNQRLKQFSDWLLDIMASGDLNAYFPAATREYAPLVYEIWKDPAIQETYKRGNEMHFLPDTAKYFLDQAIAISSNEYEPSEKDILYAEGVTPSNGLAFVELSFDDHSAKSDIYLDDAESQSPLTRYQLIRVSSKGPHDFGKWMEMFEDVTAVVFCAALSDYDQTWSLANGPPQNKMLVSRDLFESLVQHTCFKNTTFVLILNKYDLFEDKISKVPLTTCEWFNDFRPLKTRRHNQSVANQAYHYVARKFKEWYSSMTGRKLFVWPSRAREEASVDESFRYVREVVKWEEEKDRMCNFGDEHSDDSFDSATE
nr:extra-large guanine nucleotide-binding protein 3-like [Ipomoea batatas]